MKVKLATTVEKVDLERLDAEAQAMGVSLAWLVRKILSDHLNADPYEVVLKERYQ